MDEKVKQSLYSSALITLGTTTNRALAELNKYIEQSEAEPEPTIRDYYTPSKEMEGYQMIAMTVAGLGTGVVGYKVYKRVAGK